VSTKAERRVARVAAYEGRERARKSPAGQTAAAKAEQLRVEQATAYSTRHKRGRRRRLIEQRRYGRAVRGAVAVLVHLRNVPARSSRARGHYCAGLGHKWSGLRDRNEKGAVRVCGRGSCHAVEFIATTVSQGAPGRDALSPNAAAALNGAERRAAGIGSA
jgi:hypothetical protein